jgi:broad specificity phosphatase PhoE
MFLQRHGECETNVSKIFTCRKLDPVLTENGKHQIEEKAYFYKPFDIQKIVTSPSKRAIQSAEIISRLLDISFIVDEALLEVDVGELEGKSERDPEKLDMFLGILNEWFFNGKKALFPGGESKEKVESRIEKAISLLSPSTILIGHATFFAVLLWRQRMTFTEIKELFLPRAGIAQYSIEKGSWEIIRPAEQASGPDG